MAELRLNMLSADPEYRLDDLALLRCSRGLAGALRFSQWRVRVAEETRTLRPLVDLSVCFAPLVDQTREVRNMTSVQPSSRTTRM
jgi:hypothetical protein